MSSDIPTVADNQVGLYTAALLNFQAIECCGEREDLSTRCSLGFPKLWSTLEDMRIDVLSLCRCIVLHSRPGDLCKQLSVNTWSFGIRIALSNSVLEETRCRFSQGFPAWRFG